MKKILIFLFIAFCFIAVFQNKTGNDNFNNNNFIQDILKKYSAKYFSDFNTYAGRYLYGVTKKQGSIYEVSRKDAYDLVRELLKKHPDFYAFKIEQNYGINNKKDKIAVIKNITDQFELLRLMRIQGNNFTISNGEIINWFKKWHNEFDFQIIGIGIDFIQADIIGSPKDYKKLAREIYSMCPDIMDPGSETINGLAGKIKDSKTMYLWWD